MSPPSTKYHFFISQNSTSATGAIAETKSHLGDTAGLVTVPYFPLPAYYEPFTDAEGRFLQLEQLAGLFDNSDGGALRYWFAQVLPKDEGGRSEYLTVEATGEYRLVRQRAMDVCGYVSALVVEDE